MYSNLYLVFIVYANISFKVGRPVTGGGFILVFSTAHAGIIGLHGELYATESNFVVFVNTGVLGIT